MGCILAKNASLAAASSSIESRRPNRGKDRSVESAPVALQASLPSVETAADVPDAGQEDTERPPEERQPRRSRSRPEPRLSNPPRNVHGEQVAAGWPAWLSRVAAEALQGWTPHRSDRYEKISKIGQGTYSNVYKAREISSGKFVALKKVRCDATEPETVKFMAREILLLRRLDHPNVIKLEGLVISRLSSSLYLVFEYMEHDLAGLAANLTIKFTEPQVKCYMRQLLSGLEHCHNNGVLHRDIKGSNLLLNNEGIVKIADFGLAISFDPLRKRPMTSRVVTLWYRPPELLLGATDYGVGVDLWSAGCILAELFARKPILPGRSEVEQLHKIFKLCGSPSDEYWKKSLSKLPHATISKPKQIYKRCIRETFKDFPAASLPLIETLLAMDPADRQTATAAINSEFFNTAPHACDPSSLPKYSPSKEMDAKLRDEEAKRLRAAAGKTNANGSKKIRARDRAPKAVPAPEANAELQLNIDRRRLITRANARSKSDKFPPPHQDGALGYSADSSHHFDPCLDHLDAPFSTVLPNQKEPATAWSGVLGDPSVLSHPKGKKKIVVNSRNGSQLKQFAGAHVTKETERNKGSARF